MLKGKNIFFFCGPDKYSFEACLEEIKKKHFTPDTLSMAWTNLDGDELDGHDLASLTSQLTMGSEYTLVSITNIQRIRSKNSVRAMVTGCFENCFLIAWQPDYRIKDSNLEKTLNGLKNATIEKCFAPGPRDLAGRINNVFNRQSVNIDSSAAAFLAAHFRDEPELLEKECEKLILYFGKESKDPSFIIKENDLEGLLSRVDAVTPFELVREIVLRKKKSALKLFLTYLQSGGELVLLQTLLYNELYKVLKYRELISRGVSEGQAMKDVGVYYQKARSQLLEILPLYNQDLLELMLKQLFELEILLKSESVGFDPGRKYHPGGRIFMEKIILTCCL